MKKTLLSVIAGLAVINVASAVPSPADRKALCEKHPEKYVWVEKTEACVPINPCKSNNSAIYEAYCMNEGYHAKLTSLPSEKEDIRNLIINRYVANIIKSKVTEIKLVDTDGEKQYFGIKDSDGDYFVASALPLASTSGWYAGSLCVRWAVNVYAGVDGWDMFENDGPYYTYVGKSDESLCRDMADFASLVCDELISVYPYDNKCGFYGTGDYWQY